MTKEEQAALKQWQLIAAQFLSSKETSPSELEACAIALRRDSPKLAEKCEEEAAARMGKWRPKMKG